MFTDHGLFLGDANRAEANAHWGAHRQTSDAVIRAYINDFLRAGRHARVKSASRRCFHALMR